MPVKPRNDDERTVKLINSVDLNDFKKYSSKHAANEYPIINSRMNEREKKARRIEAVLNDPNVRLSTELPKYLQTLAANEGGLLKDEFRLEIWPILAEIMPVALHLDDDDTRDTYSTRSKDSLYVPTGTLNGTIASGSRTCSDSEVYDSAVSSVSSDGVVEANDENSDENFQDSISSPVSVSIEELQSHREWNQVELDVHRTLARFPPNITGPERTQLQDDLTPMIVELLHGNDSFRYYQGFHDVCLTLMLALDVDNAKKVARHLVERSAFRNYLSKSLEESALRELHLMYVILHKCDPELERRMRHAELGTLFALSWPITWFSHSLHTFEQIALCFDLFLASDALMPIYVSAALVVHRKDEIFATEAEMPALHHLLNHIPESIDIEAVLNLATNLYNEYRPRMLIGKMSKQYEELCEFEGRKHHMPAANTLQRRSILQHPVVIGSVAAVSVALYYWLSSYQDKILM